MQVNNLPLEIQNKIFYFLDHPTAAMIKESYWEQTWWTIRLNGIRYGARCYNGHDEPYWNDLIDSIKRNKIWGERMREYEEMERMEEEDRNVKYLIHPVSRVYKVAYRFMIRSLEYGWRKSHNFYYLWKRLDKDEKRIGY